jgi:hypothetical protein
VLIQLEAALNPWLFLIGLWIEFLLGSFFLGIILLLAIPGFRLSIPNLLVFVFGAILGILELPSLLRPTLIAKGVFTNTTMAQRNQVANIEFFFGALIGGTLLILLKISLKALREIVERHVERTKTRSAGSPGGGPRK